MIIEKINDSTAEITADVVIAGAGTVGLFLGAYLVKQGLTVVLIEAGDRVAHTARDGFGASSSAKQHDGVSMARAFGLGGTSTLWGGQLAEFVEADFNRPDFEWPLTYGAICTLYQRVYAELGLPERVSDAVYRERLGIKLNDASLEHFFTTWLPQPNFAVLFSQLIRHSEKLRIYLNQTVVRAKFDAQRCQYFEAVTPSGTIAKFGGSSFVLALGTVGNSQFCLSNSVTNPLSKSSDTPWSNNPLIGAYFQDHLGGKLGDLKVQDQGRFRNLFENGFSSGQKLQPKLRWPSALAQSQPIGICGMFIFRSIRATQIANLKHVVKSLRSGVFHSGVLALPRSLWNVGMMLAPIVMRYLKDKRIMAMFDDGVDFTIQAEQVPVAESKIVRAKDGGMTPAGLVQVEVQWQPSGIEAAAIRSFLTSAQEFFRLNQIGEIVPSANTQGDDQMLMDSLSDTYHQCGGMRMSQTQDTGVVDSDAKIWGTQNVYVAGASVFPTSSYANCTLTALALSLRTADHIVAGKPR